MIIKKLSHCWFLYCLVVPHDHSENDNEMFEYFLITRDHKPTELNMNNSIPHVHQENNE